MSQHRILRVCVAAALALGMGWTVPAVALAQKDGTTSPAGSPAGAGVSNALKAAVSVEFIDAGGKSLRTVNGTLLSEGLVVSTPDLVGAATGRVRARDGKTWTVDTVASNQLGLGIAVLQMSDIPDYAITITNTSFMIGGSVNVLRGPAGSGPEMVAAKVFDRFSLRDLKDTGDFVAISTGFPAAAAVVDPTGRLIGVSVSLSEPDMPIFYMVPAASLKVIAAARGTSLPISAFSRADTPQFQDKTNIQGLTFRGALLERCDKNEDGRRFLSLALKKDPNSVDANYWMGQVVLSDAMNEKQFDVASAAYLEAASYFQKATAADPGFHMGWHMAGVAYHQAARYPDAEKMYNKAIEANPRSALTYCNMGGTLHVMSRTDDAIQAFRRSIELDPSYGLAYYNLAMVLNSTGRRADAEQVYQDLLRRDPKGAQQLRAVLDGKQK